MLVWPVLFVCLCKWNLPPGCGWKTALCFSLLPLPLPLLVLFCLFCFVCLFGYWLQSIPLRTLFLSHPFSLLYFFCLFVSAFEGIQIPGVFCDCGDSLPEGGFVLGALSLCISLSGEPSLPRLADSFQACLSRCHSLDDPLTFWVPQVLPSCLPQSQSMASSPI